MNTSTRVEHGTVDSRSLAGILLDFVSALVPLVASWRRRNAQRYASVAANARIRGDLAEAESYCMRALDWQPADPSLRSALGQVYYDHGKREEAVVQFKKALDLDYKNQVALKGLAVILHQEGNTSDAMYYYRRYLELNPRDGDTLLNLGTIFHSLGEFQKAIEYYTQAENCGTDPVLSSKNHALALFSLGQPAEAIPILEHALTLAPEDADSHRLLGNALETSGDFEAAARSYNAAIGLNPRDANAQANLAQILSRRNLFRESLEHMQIAAEIYEKKGEEKLAAFACWDMGWSYYRLRDYELSIRSSSKALSLNPDLAPVHFNLGLVLLHLGRSGEALAEYEKGIQGIGQLSDLETHAIYDLRAAMSAQSDLPGAADILKMLEEKYNSLQQQYLSRSTGKQA